MPKTVSVSLFNENVSCAFRCVQSIYSAYTLHIIPQEKVVRCFIELYCNYETDFSQLTLPFERFSGEYAIKFMACAIISESSRNEIYMETDYVRRGVLKRRLMALGCRGVTVHSFSRNDTERLAEKFYGRVMEKANTPGAIFYTRGTASIEPLVERVSDDYDVWYQELLELGQREKMVIHTYQIPGSSDEDDDDADRGSAAATLLPQVGSVLQLTAAESAVTSVQRTGGGKRRMVVSAPVEGVVVRELTEKAEELECIAGVLDERVAEGQKRLEECEAARQAEGEQLRALLAEQKAEYEARLEAAAAQHRALVVAKDAEWEARLAGKVLELMSVSGSGSASPDARVEHDARVAAVVAECEAKLAAKDVACGERLAAREAEHARSKDVLDAKKLRDLKAAHQKEMDRRLTKLRLELADERRLGGRLRAELAEAQGRVDELEDQVGAAGDEDDDDMVDQGTMRGMQESARNQHLKDLLVNAAVMRNGAWLERDAAKDRVVELERQLDEKNLEMEMAVHRLRVEIKGLEVVIADEKQLRRREGKGDIFHEDGRVLIKCSKCFQVLRRLFSLYLIIHQPLPPP